MSSYIARIKKQLETIYEGSENALQYLPFYLEPIATKEDIKFQNKRAENWLDAQLDFELFIWAMQQLGNKYPLPERS